MLVLEPVEDQAIGATRARTESPTGKVKVETTADRFKGPTAG